MNDSFSNSEVKGASSRSIKGESFRYSHRQMIQI